MPQKKAMTLATAALVGGYVEKIEKFSCEDFLKSGIDPFRFGMNVAIWGLGKSVRKEIEHKIEMTLENLVGDFHETYLGNTDHVPSGTAWKKVPAGQMPGVDIANEQRKHYLQIKSKHNSMNSSSAKRLAQELAELKKKKPGARVGCGWVIATSTRQGIGEGYIRAVGECLKGREVYGTVTGNKSEMDEVVAALPETVKALCKEADFDKLLNQATDRVIKQHETKASAKKLSVPAYIYHVSVD